METFEVALQEDTIEDCIGNRVIGGMALNKMARELVISLDDNMLLNYLRESKGGGLYFNMGAVDDAVLQQVKDLGFIEVRLNDNDPRFNERFLKLYVDLIGRLSTKYNSIYWWATSMASKDRFGSRLFENLYRFFSLVGKIDSSEKDKVLIINPPEELVDSLSSFGSSRSYSVKVLSGWSGDVVALVKGALRQGFIWLSFVLNAWRKIYLANKSFRGQFNNTIRPDGSYYLLRSWLYTRSFSENNEYRDLFFGTLPDFLASRGIKFLIVGGVIHSYNEVIRRIEGYHEYPVYPQELFANILDPIRAVADVYLNKLRFIDRISFEGYDITPLVQKEIDKEYMNRGVLNNYMQTFYIKNILSKLNIHTFITTYENYPWEKMCYLTLKKFSPQTKVIGYQHGQFLPAITSFYLSRFEKEVVPMPDEIITTGKKTKEYLEEYGNYDCERIRAGCALKVQRRSTDKTRRREKIEKILVVLGEYDRGKRVAELVYLALKDKSQYQIVLRPHPATPVQRFVRELKFDLSNHQGIRLSKTESLREELGEADIVVYDASTVSFEALMLGIPLIHVDLRDTLSFDPLFGCNSFKWIAKDENELIRAIESISLLSDEKFYELQAKARDYVEDYLYAVTEERLEEFIT